MYELNTFGFDFHLSSFLYTYICPVLSTLYVCFINFYIHLFLLCPLWPFPSPKTPFIKKKIQLIPFTLIHCPSSYFSCSNSWAQINTIDDHRRVTATFTPMAKKDKQRLHLETWMNTSKWISYTLYAHSRLYNLRSAYIVCMYTHRMCNSSFHYGKLHTSSQRGLRCMYCIYINIFVYLFSLLCLH